MITFYTKLVILYPVGFMEDNKTQKIDRRQFVKRAGGFVGAGAAMSLLPGCGSDLVSPVIQPAPTSFSIDLTDPKYTALQNVGGAVLTSGIIIIRRSTTVYVALSTVCTHAGCTVNYSANTNRLVCPCHGSVFSNSGAVVTGPATTPLPSYSVSVMGDTLTVQP